MQGRGSTIIFQTLMAGQMVFMVTALITYINFGFGQQFVGQWMHAFLISWPAAAAASFVAVPAARWMTGHIMRLTGG